MFSDENGLHVHKCSSCHCTWQHPSWCAGSNKHHECPKCGKEERWKFPLEQLDKPIDFPWDMQAQKNVSQKVKERKRNAKGQFAS